MSYIDLHVHSTFSDGSYTPGELVDYAIEKGLKAFALTDHDTTDGIKYALSHINKRNDEAGKTLITLVPGIELSTVYQGCDIHILGYCIDYNNKNFLDTVSYYRDSRNKRNEKMEAVLRENGFNITTERLKKRFGEDTVITRAHYAILMVEDGVCKDKNEAFEIFLNPGCPCYVDRMKIPSEKAVDLILSAHGKPVLAHPCMYPISYDKIRELVTLLKEHGLMGIEGIYSCNTTKDDIEIASIAKDFDLFITGGSDFHGTAKPDIDLGVGHGNLKIPESILDNIL